MFNKTWFSATTAVISPSSPSSPSPPSPLSLQKPWHVFLASGFLVSVPVFFQAPLVRLFPIGSLLLTAAWILLAAVLWQSSRTRIWGDLLIGFSWSWFAGSIYWGWFRWEPLIHLPIEAIGLPFALWALWRGWSRIGHLFYLGSLIGTAITDLYFHVTHLMPYWRQLMQVEPDLLRPIFQSAIAQMQTAWGISWAIVLVNGLLSLGFWALQKPSLSWWAFGGAVLSTLFVDSLFWISALLA